MQIKNAEPVYDARVVLTFLVTVALTGINGLIAFFLLVLISQLNIGKDPENKHGLSSGTSRLGGVAILLSIFAGYSFNQFYLDSFYVGSLFSQINSLIVFSLAVALIGLSEDLNNNLSSMFRLLLMIFIVSGCMILKPQLLPSNLELLESIGLHDSLLFIYIFSIVMICGFINAGNIADGANGLLASIFLAFFVVLYDIDSSNLNFSILISLVSFIIFNVTSGRIFLGDFGAYFLSALVAFKSLEVYSNEQISVFFLASILVYPCFEISRSLIVRATKNLSLMTPDNNHLHNHLNAIILDFGFSKHISNSMTGVGIAFFTTIVPIYLYFYGISINSDIWRILFLFQLIVLSFIYIIFKKKLSR